MTNLSSVYKTRTASDWEKMYQIMVSMVNVHIIIGKVNSGRERREKAGRGFITQPKDEVRLR